MNNDIPLGRIAGIKVGMSVTVLLMVGFYTFALASFRFPNTVPGIDDRWYWVAGLAAALCILLSLLAHEIGHALVARDEGIGVESMGLTVWGGVTRMQSSPTTAGAEFRVAVVGPLATAACGVVFLVLSYFVPDEGSFALAGDVFLWVGELNFILAAVNLIPGAPLDGGRVLSAAFWRITQSQSRAAIWSAGSGVVVGMVLLTYGIRELRSADTSQFAYFFLLIGALIAITAVQQLRTMPLYRALDGRVVTDAMAADPPTAPGWATVGEFLRTTAIRPENQAYPVVGPDGQVSGLLTAAAIRATHPQQLDHLAVSDLAYPLSRLTVVHADEPLLPALQKVEGGEVRHALVVAHDGRILGTIDPSAVDRMVERHKAQTQARRAAAH